MKPQNEIIFDSRALENLLEESDPPVLIGFFKIFLDHTITLWGNAEVAADNGDWSKVSALAHSIKSSSRSLGANALGAAMLTIEQATADNNPAPNQVRSASELVEKTRKAIEEHMTMLQERMSCE
jgi:HPt (histidine-containing phosphotransfer) domain-containing protein